MSSNCRSEARSVILRLRRYRDRMEEIATATADAPAESGTAANVARRKIKALKSDLDNDAHECEIDRKRAVQTECEHQFLWPALREASGAIRETPSRPAGDFRSGAELRAAQFRIQHYLGQLEGLYPTL